MRDGASRAANCLLARRTPSAQCARCERGWRGGAGERAQGATGCQQVHNARAQVLEETGLDIACMWKEQDCIDAQLGDQDTRLFIVSGIPETTHFAPHVRYEIGAFAWHIVEHLPATYAESKQAFVNEAGGRHKFFNVWPYIRPLRAWIERRRHQTGGKKGGKKVVVAALPKPSAAAPAVAAATAAARPAPAAASAAPAPAATTPGTPPTPPPAAAAAADTPPPPAAAASAGPRPPGFCLLAFKFDRSKLMQHLAPL